MTAVDIATPGQARARVDRIKTGVEVIWHLIVESYQARDWDALGYATWDEMCTREFGSSHLRLPREERAETVQSLRDAGMSLRAISAATGNDVKTIRKDLAQVREIPTPAPAVKIDTATGEVLDDAPLTQAECEQIEQDRTGEPVTVESLPTPALVTGLDGKTYRPAPPKPAAAVTPATVMRQARAEYKASPWSVFNEKLAEIDKLTEWLRLDEIGGPEGVVRSMREMGIPGDIVNDATQVLSTIGRAERTLAALRETFAAVGSSKLRSVR